jgi:cytochrome c oxidase subunit 2
MMHSIIKKFAYLMKGGLIPLSHLEDKGTYSSVANLPELVNHAFFLVLIISVVLLALVTFFMVYFAVRYRRTKNPVPREVKEPLALEIAWTVIPLILVLIMFYVGWINFVPLRRTPADAMHVNARARMWSWQFEYENGLKSPVLRVPRGKAVKLLLTSSDVIHSLFIPKMRIKEDVVPGMENFLWIHADREGEFDIFCAEYCGQGHSSMNSKVMVLPEEEFTAWYEAVKGEETKDHEIVELLEDNGCLDCHSTDGSIIEGPTFKGIYGRKIIVVKEGKEREITADELYLKRSILYPNDEIVKGYPGIMPSFEGEIPEEAVNSIIQYLKTLQ